ncbi:hypothetical protein KR059_002959, partial [Drosophila kikkawai]
APRDTTVVGFADDVAVVVVASALQLADAITSIESRLASAGLELAAHKTEAVLISSRKIVETAEIRLGGAVHLEYAQKKASRTAGSLSRLLQNTRGPKEITRKLLAIVVTFQM